MTDIDSQLTLVPASLQMFLRPIVKTDESVAVCEQNCIKACRPRSGVLSHQMGLSIQPDHRFRSKWMLKKFHRLGYTESYTETQNYKYCFLNSRSRDDVPDTSGTLYTIVEETEEQINDDVALDAVLEDQSLITAKVPASESELSGNDHVVSMESGETNNAVTQFVGDNMDSNIVSIHGKHSLPINGLDQTHLSGTTFAISTDNTSCPPAKVKGTDKAKILKGGEVKSIPFMNRKEI